MNRQLRFGIWLVLLPALARAGSGDGAGFSLSGFGTLGIARSSDDSAQYVRDLSQWEGLDTSWRFENDTLFGLQANLSLSPDLEAVAQGVTRYRYDGSYDPDLTWAYLRYAPSPYWTLRAGRLGTEFYMLADSRMIGYSYVMVRPPPDYYGTLPFNYFDGADLAATLPVAGGLLRGKVYAGVTKERVALGDAPPFDLSGSLILGGYLDYFTGPWQLRLGHAQLRFERDLPLEDFYTRLPSSTAEDLRIADKWSRFTSLGLIYDSGPLQAQFMVSKSWNDHATYQDTWAAYLVASYRIGEVTPFAGVSTAKSTPKTLDRPVHPFTDLYQRDFHTDQRTFFVGARWDFMKNMCLKAQVDMVRGATDSLFLYFWDKPDWDGSMTVLSMTWDFVF